ncbi:MAG TPA: amidohydrolase, partial [Hyphomonas sp.]|nr:amidohydrolase [Hyphomonas sp.]
MFNNSDWLAQVKEDIVDPDREIIDPHHHLWPQADMYYNVPEFLADLTSGHNVVQTVFMECGAAYREDGPDHLKPVGETEFVA